MKLIVRIVFSIGFMLISVCFTSCQREQTGQNVQTAIPLIEQTPTPPGFFTTTETTPNGELLLNCWYEGWLVCSLEYPNGNQVPYWMGSDGPEIWFSYNNQYALICNRLNHDSPSCLNGYGMWQMTNGERVEFQLPDFGGLANYDPAVEYHWTQFTQFKWKQDENLLAYFYQPDQMNRLGGLVIFDPETGMERFEKECPDWLFSPTHETGERTLSLDWTAVCNIINEQN